MTTCRLLLRDVFESLLPRLRVEVTQTLTGSSSGPSAPLEGLNGLDLGLLPAAASALSSCRQGGVVFRLTVGDEEREAEAGRSLTLGETCEGEPVWCTSEEPDAAVAWTGIQNV